MMNRKDIMNRSDMKPYMPVDADFIDKATNIHRLKQRIPVSADELFAWFATPQTWTLWLPIDSVTWLTKPETHGRRIIVAGRDRFEEFFLRWDPGKRITFRFDKGTSGLLAAFAEDFRIEPDGANTCILHFKFRFKMSGLWKIATPLLTIIYSLFVRRSLKKLSRLVAPPR